jgi:hypothetical protein
MKTLSAFLAVFALGAVLLGVQATRSLRARVGEIELALERAQKEQRDLSGALTRCNDALAATTPAVAHAPEDSANARECPDVVMSGEATRPKGEPSLDAAVGADEKRGAVVRSHLERQIRSAFEDGELDERAQSRAVDLLMRIRALRSLQGGRDLDESTPDERRDELVDTQRELQSLTGMGVGEFLRRIDVAAEGRSVVPDQAPEIMPGEERKRFADEAARTLGIVAPGSKEIFEDGEWKSE